MPVMGGSTQHPSPAGRRAAAAKRPGKSIRPWRCPDGEPDVAYQCTFKGADTATFIKLTFQVKYDQD